MNFTTILIVLAAAIVAVALLMLGMYITYYFKGHHIESDVGSNRNMKKLGIKCASHQFREEERALRGESFCSTIANCSPNGCNSCSEFSDTEFSEAEFSEAKEEHSK